MEQCPSSPSSRSVVHLVGEPCDTEWTTADVESPRMFVSAVRRRGDTVFVGLMVGDYFDGDVPAGLWISGDGGATFALRTGLPLLTSNVVANIGVDPRGRVCVSANGNALQCFA